MAAAPGHKLDLGSVVAISTSAMLGSGIFVLPGLASGMTGPTAWLAYVIAALGVLPAAVSKAELGAAIPTSGGTYVYIERTFGPLSGTIAGLGLWLSLLLKSSFALVGFGAYLAVLTDVHVLPASLLLLGCIVGLNIVGVKHVSRVQVITVTLAVGSLGLLSLWGLTRISWQLLQPAFPMGYEGCLSAAAFVFVSYAGVTKVAAIAEEIKDPGRNLPLGILLSLGLVTLVYGLTVFTLTGLVPWTELGGDLRPVHTMFERLGGHSLGVFAALLGIITMTSMANAGILAASRFPFVMARDRLLPAALSVLHPRFLTPVQSIVATGAMMALALLLLDVKGMAKLASAFVIMIYMAEMVAVIVLRETSVVWYRPPYRAPFYPWTQGLGLCSGAVLLGVMGLSALSAGLLMLIPGGMLFLLYSRHKTSRRGVVGRLGRRDDLFSSSPAVAVPAEDLVDGTSTPVAAADVPVVVGLFGRERSPEMLVEVGAAMADGRRMEVVHLTEVPEQTVLDAVDDETILAASLRRRLSAMTAERHLDLSFSTAVTHDLVKSVHAYASRLHSEWLVCEWKGRSTLRWGITNPLGWLIHHIPCNLALFRDRGVRYVRKILVYAEPGPHDALVASSADHLAGIYGAELTFVRFVADHSPATALQSQVDYLLELKQLCQATSHIEILRGPKEVPALVRATAACDLLVMGGPPVGTFVQNLRGTDKDQLMQQSACSVLRLTTPREKTHAAIEKKRKKAAPGADSSDLIQYLDPSFIETRFEVARKEALFTHLGERFASVLESVQPRDVVDALWEREKVQNTAVGYGLALPHATLGDAPRSFLGITTLSEPIDYGAPDGQPVDVLFVTIGPPSERQTHLHLLAGISRLVLKTPLLERLREAEVPQQIVVAFEECSRHEIAD